jgi:hypothetical protein
MPSRIGAPDTTVTDVSERVDYVVRSLLLQNRSLCRCVIVNDGSALQHFEYHRDNALALGNILLAASYDALIEASGLST